MTIWMHSPAVLWLCWAMYLLLRSPSGIGFVEAVAVGFTLGMATLARPTAGLFPVFTMLAFVGLRQWKQFVGVELGGVVPALTLLATNRLLQGNLIFGGYHSADWSMSTPFWVGFTGLLIAPSRGLFVYSPALLLMPWGLAALFRKPRPTTDPAPTAAPAFTAYDRWIVLSWLSAAMGTIFFFSKWYIWYGGWGFGPRFLSENMPIFCLLFAFAYDRLKTLSMRRVAAGLVALSVAIHAIGTFGRTAEADWYMRREDLSNHGWLFTLSDTQIECYARCVWNKVAVKLSLPMVADHGPDAAEPVSAKPVAAAPDAG
jgi:hypothetical protein